MYWDLNIAYPANKQQAKLLAQMAIQLGYDGIVWTKTVTTKLTPKENNNMDLPDVSETWNTFGAQQSVLRLKQPDYQSIESAASIASQAASASSAAAPSPATPAASSSSSSLPVNHHGFQQRTRLHMVIEDQGQLHSLNATNLTLQSYDLVSVSSSNEKLFHSCCSHESVDIITIEVSRKLPFYLKKPAINLAFERGIHFEFSYAPSIRDATSRRYLFSNLLSMLRLTKGRNMILTSDARKEMELRAPWDVINLGVLCGVDAATSKASISSHARSVLLHADARKTMKCVLKEVKLPTTTNATRKPAAASPTLSDHPKPIHNDQETKHKDKKQKMQHGK